MDFDEFLDSVPSLIEQNAIWPNPPGQGSVHDPIGRALKEWLARLDLADVQVCAEGLAHLGIPTVPNKLRGAFCGSSNWPDIALVHPLLKVAIEVDRARGMGGASVRTAMTKGSFNYLTGKFDRCLVLVFLEGGCKIAKDKDSERIFASYQTFFRTHVHLFERDAGNVVKVAG